MKPSRLTVTEKPAKEIAADLLVFCALEIKDKSPECDPAVNSRVERLFPSETLKGKPRKNCSFTRPLKKDLPRESWSLAWER